MSQPYDPNTPHPGIPPQGAQGFGPGVPQGEFATEQPNRFEAPTGANAYTGDEPNVQPLTSIGDIVGNISKDISTLIRQETELAKAEVKESAGRAGKGAGMLAGAGVAGHMFLIFASLLLWWILADAFDSFGWAFFTVAALWGAIAAALAITGRTQLKNIKGIPQTTQTVKEIPDALKGNEETR